MEDFPRTLRELESRFATEDACRECLARLRWPNGFVCPKCGASGGWQTARGLQMCSACGHQVSVTAGTIFQDTRTPLPVWFRAIWWVVSQKNGASALGMQRILGLGSYRTAWTWLHKLRRAMVRPGRERDTPPPHAPASPVAPRACARSPPLAIISFRARVCIRTPDERRTHRVRHARHHD